MSRKDFYEFMEVFLKGLNLFKIQTKFKLDLLLNFIIKIQRDLEVGKKGNSTLPSLEIFGDKEGCVLYF
jgi:hypothetical protein